MIRLLKGKLSTNQVTFNGTPTGLGTNATMVQCRTRAARGSADGPCVTMEYRLGAEYCCC